MIHFLSLFFFPFQEKKEGSQKKTLLGSNRVQEYLTRLLLRERKKKKEKRKKKKEKRKKKKQERKNKKRKTKNKKQKTKNKKKNQRRYFLVRFEPVFDEIPRGFPRKTKVEEFSNVGCESGKRQCTNIIIN